MSSVRDVTVRTATDDDLAAIATVMTAVGRDYEWGGGNPDYVRHLSGQGEVVVAEVAGTVAGFGATERLGTGADAITMLCDLFVDPAAHGRGCGRAMLTRLWGRPGRRMTFSSLHSHAVPLYTSFGLDAWWPLLELHGDVRRLPVISDGTVEPAAPGIVARYELTWTGLDRLADHRAWAQRPGGECVLVSRDAEVIAAGSVITSGRDRGIEHLAISPAADDDSAAAVVLLTLAQLGGAPAEPGHVCLPGPHPAVRALLAAGWRYDEFDLFMASEPGLLDPRRAVPSPAQA